MSWKKLSTKKILEHPRLTVYEDQVQLPNGHRTDYLYFGATHDAVTIIAINEHDQILLQKEYSYPMHQKLYQFPGGSMETSEQPLEAALRELTEEAQLQGTLTPLGWFYINNRRSAQKMHVFVAGNLQPARATRDLEEEFEDFWFTPDQITAMIRAGDIVNYSTLAAWAMYLSQP